MKNWRIDLILLFILLFAATITSRLVFLQIINKNFYQALAAGQQNISQEIVPLRGEIFFNDGKTKLATNYSFKNLYISPSMFKKEDRDKDAEALSLILGLKKDFVLEKLNLDSSNEILKNNLTDEEINEVKKLKLDGLYVTEETKRYYPQESLASHIVGYVGGEGRGQYGLEEFYEKDLKGEAGILEGEKDSRGTLLFFSLDKYLEPRNGSDLVLTVDYNIQFLAEKLLKEAKQNLQIEEGTILVLSPDSGKIIALANTPSFNPDNYSSYKDLEIFQDSAIQKIFEPGSVIKPITMAAALNEGKITPTTTYDDPGKIKIGDYTISNYDGRTYGKNITMTEVLEKSINTGAVFAESQLGDDGLFLKYIKDFGLLEKTKIDLAGEIFSANKSLKEGTHLNYTTASFGQGIAITSIQLARAFSIIANGGKSVNPYIVERTIGGGKEINTSAADKNPEQIISSKTASDVTAMMVSVIENGYSKKAKIPGYYIAGKTGTAQVPWAALEIEKPGYSNKTIQSFIGFAPAFNPKFLILVKLDNPKASTAEYSALPIFHDLAKYIIDYLQIPPDYQQ